MTRKPATAAIHNGLNEDTQFGCVVPPLYLSSTYNFTAFEQPREHDYSRRGNPGRDITGRTLAELEGGAGAVVTGSGMSALHLLLTAFLSPGEVIVAPFDCYGGTYRLLDSCQQRGHFRVIFTDLNDDAALDAALVEKPALLLIETPGNPLLRITDITAVSRKAHQAGALVAADNTFLSPVLQQPLALGADFVIHSCTKFLNGHSDVVAGAVISADPAHHETLTWWANNIGVTLGAFDSYLLLRGIRTLVPRLRLQEENARAIAVYLSRQPAVKTVYYPGLPDHPGHALATEQQQGYGAIVSFELNGEKATISRFLSHLSLFTLAESLGGVETLISHAATMTHAGMPEAARQAAGISDTLLRISAGIEDSGDLLAALDHAFQSVTKG